jgi:hypothetical protein
MSANETVLNFEKKSAQVPDNDEETSGDEEESSNEDDDFHERSTGDERVVGHLLSKITSWQHAQAHIH